MARLTFYPRPELEIICGVSPIETAYDPEKRVIVFRNNGRLEEMGLGRSKRFDQWFDREVKFCKRKFMK